MRTIAPLLAIALLATACGSLQTTTQVRDDVYDIPERNAVAAVGGESEASSSGLPDGFVEDYYDPSDSGKYNVGYADERSYEDITYNDPQYYNYDRFGFNVGLSTWGPTFGMNYGTPGYGDPWGNPYYNNSWMSGYGAWGSPWYGSGWNMGVSMNWGGYGYGGSSYYGGYNPYGGFYPYSGCCYGCGELYGSSGSYQHRPTFGGGTSSGDETLTVPVPRQYRPNTLVQSRPSAPNEVRQSSRSVDTPSRSSGTKSRTQGQRSESTRSSGSQPREGSSGGSRSSGSTGGGGGGGSRPSTGGGRR